jgi:hypothetical protein
LLRTHPIRPAGTPRRRGRGCISTYRCKGNCYGYADGSDGHGYLDDGRDERCEGGFGIFLPVSSHSRRGRSLFLRPPGELHRDIKTAPVRHVNGVYQKPIGLGGRRWCRRERREGWFSRSGGGSDRTRVGRITCAKTAISASGPLASYGKVPTQIE